jgi:uncharacterized protein (DUF849 family)
MLIQVALNGSRPPAEHPAIPSAPDRYAAEAKAAVHAGAGAIHLHVRAPDGRESIDPDDVARVVSAVRAACPTTPIGISTGAWIVRDPADRLALVGNWTVLPDYASVNVCERGSDDLMRLLMARGIGVEAGVWTAADANALVDSQLVDRCLRVMLEPMEPSADAARENVAQIVAVLDGAMHTGPRLLHGTGPTAWPMIDEATARGYDTRVGFEDTLTLPDGSVAADNAALVAAARQAAGLDGSPTL